MSIHQIPDITVLKQKHGQFCASRPLEVIAAVIAATTTTVVILFSYAESIAQHSILTNSGLGFTFWPKEFAPTSQNPDLERLRLTILTFVRCFSVLYCYCQLRMVQHLYSKSVAGIAILFALASAILFSSMLISILDLQYGELGDSILFYLIWMDLSRVSHVIRIGFRSTNKIQLATDVGNTIGRLGPLMTFDSVIQVTVISLGLVSGMRQLEVLSTLALLAIGTNYTIFMTVFPASMCVITELMRKVPEVASNLNIGLNAASVAMPQQTEQRQQELAAALQRGSLPVVGRVSATPRYDQMAHINSDLSPILKLVIGASFLLFQSCGYWSIPDFVGHQRASGVDILNSKMSPNINVTEELTDDACSKIMSYLFLRFDQIVISSLLFVLAIKYIFYDHKMDSSSEDFSNFGLPKDTPIQRVLPVVNKNSKCGLNTSHNSTTTDESINHDLTKKGRSFPSVDRMRGISFTVGESESDSDLEGSRTSSIVLTSKEVQTLESFIQQDVMETTKSSEKRSLEECINIYNSVDEGAKRLTDAEVIALVDAKHLPAYQLEKAVQDEERGVSIRRKLISRSNPSVSNAFEDIPFKNYDYSKITGACCENVVGYVPVPVGVVGPLKLDGKMYQVPMATTEGCLVASTNRGCRALCDGVRSRVVGDGMSRGPVVRFPNAMRSSDAAQWLSDSQNFQQIKICFDGSSRFARLQKVTSRPAGRYLFIRFVAKTGDAMGMNMISKGTEVALNILHAQFPDMEILSLSGNFCTDKKPAAVNWIEGRGKSVVAEAVIPAKIIQNVLKTSASSLVELNVAKFRCLPGVPGVHIQIPKLQNLVGSAVAGSIGGFNAHAANIVAAIYIATGQDAAQCVGSSNCITLMETWGSDNEDLYISCTMPSIEVGTIGGGTCLPPQRACLSVLGIQGPHLDVPGENARELARIVCATVLAGELSLMSALAAGQLVRSHLKLNRSSIFDGGNRMCFPVSSSSPPSFNESSRVVYSVESPTSSLIQPTTHSKTDVEFVDRISIKTSSATVNFLNSKQDAINVEDNNCNTKNITKEAGTNHTLISQQAHVSMPQAHTLPPTTTMDFLSVPTECKQF